MVSGGWLQNGQLPEAPRALRDLRETRRGHSRTPNGFQYTSKGHHLTPQDFLSNPLGATIFKPPFFNLLFLQMLSLRALSVSILPTTDKQLLPANGESTEGPGGMREAFTICKLLVNAWQNDCQLLVNYW